MHAFEGHTIATDIIEIITDENGNPRTTWDVFKEMAMFYKKEHPDREWLPVEEWQSGFEDENGQIVYSGEINHRKDYLSMFMEIERLEQLHIATEHKKLETLTGNQTKAKSIQGLVQESIDGLPDLTTLDDIEQQNVSNITKGIIILLFRDYWATEIQRKKITTKQNYDRMKLEKEKQAKYNADIFKKRNNRKEHNGEEDISRNELAVIEYKKSLFKKFINKIKSIFERK